MRLRAKLDREAPWFPFWAKNWLTDEGLIPLTPEQLGAYVRLLAHAWTSAEPSTLPKDERLLAHMARVSVRRWKSIAPGILARFDDLGTRYRDRMLYETLQIIREVSEIRSEAGRKGAFSKHAIDRALRVSVGGDGKRTAIACEQDRQREDQLNDRQKSKESAEESPDAERRVTAIWREAYGGQPSAIALECARDLVAEHGIETVCKRLRNYVDETDARFASFRSFAEKFGAWEFPRPLAGRGRDPRESASMVAGVFQPGL